MSIPAAIPTVRVTGTYLGPDGRPLKGTVTFSGPPILTFPGSDLFMAGAVAASLDENGRIVDADGNTGVTLPATDSPGMNPDGWAYTVKESLTGVTGTRTYALLLPRATPLGTIDLADVVSTDPATPNYVPVPGPSAYEVAVSNGFVGTQAQWLASLKGATGSGNVDTVNGKPGPNPVLTAADVGAVPNTVKPTSSRAVTLLAPVVSDVVVCRIPFAGTVKAVRAYMTGGTAVTINASNNGADLLPTNLSVVTPSAWTSGASLQNTALAAGASLAVHVRSVTGSPASLVLQVDVEGV